MSSEAFINSCLMENPRYRESKRLNKHEYQVLSQNGEDGIISEIFNRIGVTNKFFVETGIGDGIENNTTHLILNKFSGLWIESNSKSVKNIEKKVKNIIHQNKLILKNAFVNAENIEELFREAKVPNEFDLLSIDIDGNDYWVWKSIKNYNPRLVVIEYNASLGPKVEWIMKYNPVYLWDGTSYFGASLKALEILGQEKGYTLVGCDFTGVNAFFVRSDLVDEKFLSPFTSENHYEPPRYFLKRRLGRTKNYKIFENI